MQKSEFGKAHSEFGDVLKHNISAAAMLKKKKKQEVLTLFCEHR